MLVGQRTRFKKGQSEFGAVIDHHVAGSEYFVRFDSRRHADRVVDLDLPKPVSSGEYSWWRLDGYETNEEEDSDDECEDCDDEEGEDE